MSESTKLTSNESENGNKSKPLLCEVFEAKIIIAGTIVFEPYLSEIQKWVFDKIIYSNEDLEKILNEIESKGLDYIVLPDFKRLFYSKNYGIQKKLNEIRIMCKDAGWGLDF